MSAGIIRSRVPAAEYMALPGINISRLKEFKRSPLHFRYRCDNPPDTVPLRLGTAAHCAVLEPERWPHQFAVWSRRSEKTGNLCPRNGQFWDAFQAEHKGLEILTEDEASTALTIGVAIRADRHAMRYLAAGDPEVTMQWTSPSETLLGQPTDVECKGRADWITHLEGVPYLVGVKTSRDVRGVIFGNLAYRLGYHMQWAFYVDGYRAIKGVTPKVREIVVESAPPHDVVVYQIPEDVIEQGRADYEVLLRQYVACQASNEWPGVGNDAEQVFTLPSYAYPTADDLSDLELE